MGGLLRTPKVQIAPSAPAAPTAAADGADGSDGVRRRRGLAATIATSDRGLADDPRLTPTRKSLLGE